MCRLEKCTHRFENWNTLESHKFWKHSNLKKSLLYTSHCTITNHNKLYNLNLTNHWHDNLIWTWPHTINIRRLILIINCLINISVKHQNKFYFSERRQKFRLHKNVPSSNAADRNCTGACNSWSCVWAAKGFPSSQQGASCWQYIVGLRS